MRGYVLDYSNASLVNMLDSLSGSCWSCLYHKSWPVCAVFGLAVHQFLMFKNTLGGFKVDKFGSFETKIEQLLVKMLQAHNYEVQSRNRLLCKAKANRKIVSHRDL